jgi:hypothetical protein
MPRIYFGVSAPLSPLNIMLKELFTSKIRVRVLKLFLDNLEESFHIRDITRRVDTEINAVRRELDNLQKIGLLKRVSKGNKVLFSVREDFILLPELLVMFAKEYGLPSHLKKEAGKLGYIKFIAIHLSLLKKESHRQKVDVLIVGNINLEKLAQITNEEGKNLGCEINYSVISEEELKFFKTRQDRFFTDFVSQPFSMVIGKEQDFLN